MSLFGMPSPNDLLNTGLNALFGKAGANADSLPKKSTLSSRVSLSFMSPVDGTSLEVAEFDEMSKQKLFEEKKRFKPFGSSKTIVLMKDNGWELSFTGHKTDGLLNKLIYLQEKYLNGTGISTKPNKENTINAIGVLAYKPLFEIFDYTMENNKIPTNYVYKEATITGYAENTPADNQPVTYTLNVFSPYREQIILGNNEAETVLEKSISDIILDLISKNKQ